MTTPTAAPERRDLLTSALRIVLAVGVLLIYLADPGEPLSRPLARAVLTLFVAYAAIAFALARRGRPVPAAAAPWIDVGWVTLVVAVSEATSHVSYPLYLFAILCASFWRGLRSGLAVTLASAVSFAAVGALAAQSGPELELRSFVIRPLYLLVLGYLSAVWAGHEVRSRARLALLREVTALSNPRFGIDRTVARVLEAVRGFYDAESCRLVVAEEHIDRRWMWAATRDGAAQTKPLALPRELTELLLAAPEALALLARPRLGGELDLELVDLSTWQHSHGDPDLARELMTALDAGTLLSVPFRYHANARGRLYVAHGGSFGLDRGELGFLGQVVDQVLPMLDNVRLVDRLASEAAEEERLRIARDIHDSVIQPYLGLRLGLAAAQKAFSAGKADEAGGHVARLVEVADAEIQTLRGYVRELRAADALASGSLLDVSVRRFCGRFSAATGIRVDVVAPSVAAAGDRLAAEVFQLVAEALSNVRRHTSATRAEVRIACAEERLTLTVTNDGSPAAARAGFVPRSLGERAAALGGSLRIGHLEAGKTAVEVEIPL
jgi:signal transduction histidine kinase